MIHRIRAEHLLTDVATVHSPGVLDHEDGQVVWSGPDVEAPDRRDVGVTEVSGVLMPGLVNAHAHTAMVVLRGAGENLPVDRWLHEVMWPREAKLTPDDVRAGMTLGTAELLANGVTTSLEMYFHGQAMAEAVDAVGIRSIVTAPIIEEAQLARFGTWQQQLADMVEMVDTWAASDRVQVGIGPHAVYSTSEACLRAVAEAAAERRMLVHIHVDEQRWEDAAVRQQTGGFGATEWLHHLGMFATKVVAAHCVWSSDSDLDLFARHDVGVSHCPCSNTKHGSGAARVTTMRSAGVKVGLGTDGPASHHRLDMFEEMRTALRLARVSAHDPQALTPAEVLAMATSESADAIGRPDLGRLHPGSKADMIAVDMGGPAFHPIVAAEDDLVSRLVWGATPADVRSVWVGGTVVARNGEVTTVDLPAALARVGEIAERLAR
jgi:5-methylthioadenosine/S-adenosylhomocysteine deaminase